MRRVFIVLTAVFLVLTAASYLGEVDPWFDLAAHFRLYYGILAIVMLVLAHRVSPIIHRGWRISLAAVVVSQGAAIASFYIGGSSESESGRTIRVMQFNVFGRNPHHANVVDLVCREDAEVVSLQEVGSAILDELTTRGYRVLVSDLAARTTASHGNAILLRNVSRFEVAGLRRVAPFGPRGQHFLAVELASTDLRFEVVTAHLLPPNHEKNRERRRKYLDALVAFLSVGAEERIFCGDLNTTPFSSEWDRFVDCGLRSAADGYGYLPTWPVRGLRRPLRIPIDHVLHSQGVRVRAYEVLDESAGSDHFPIVCELAFDTGVAKEIDSGRSIDK